MLTCLFFWSLYQMLPVCGGLNRCALLLTFACFHSWKPVVNRLLSFNRRHNATRKTENAASSFFFFFWITKPTEANLFSIQCVFSDKQIFCTKPILFSSQRSVHVLNFSKMYTARMTGSWFNAAPNVRLLLLLLLLLWNIMNCSCTSSINNNKLYGATFF